MEESSWIALASVLASFLIAVLSLWWSYKSRTAPHREFLYRKQIEAYEEVLDAMSRMSQPCYNYLAHVSNQTIELTPESRVEIRKMLDKLWDDNYPRLQANAWSVLPLDVSIAVNNFLKKLIGIPESDNSAERLQRILWDAEALVFNEIRKAAGVEPLTSEMQRIFGVREGDVQLT